MKGIELLFSDQLNEAEEYFDAMRPGSFRYSLYHAEVATYVALLSCDDSDIQHAMTLLMETEALAGQLAQKYRTHSNIRKMNAAVSTIKSWALGKISKKFSANIVPGKSSTPDTEEEQVKDNPIQHEQNVHNHRFRRARLWALQIQAECCLMSSLLQIVGVGESWSSVVKVGYHLRRTWGLYCHCRSKLKQITKEWIAMGGSFDFQADLKNVEGDESSCFDSDEEDTAHNPETVDHADGSNPLLPLEFGCTSSEISALGNPTGDGRSSPSAIVQPDEELESDDFTSCSLLVLDVKSGVKEDIELYSLRIGLQFGEGAFNLILSLIPSSYQRALEVMRFPSDREKGLSLLKKACATTHPTTPISFVILLYYHAVIIGLLPHSPENAREGRELVNSLPSSWKSSVLFRVLHSRLERYERHLSQAMDLVIFGPHDPYSLTGKGNVRKLRSFMLDELGWCLLLQGKFSNAADCFGILMEVRQPQTKRKQQTNACMIFHNAGLWEIHEIFVNIQKFCCELFIQESVSFKAYYAFLQSSCLWEASERSHHQAGLLLRRLPELISFKKQQQLTPLEQYGLQISSKIVESNQAPLFIVLELAAVFNGFQFMDKASLELHKRCVEEVLQGRTQMHKMSSNDVPDDLLTGEDFTTGETTSRPRLHYEHKWTKSSKMICRFLLGVCQKNLGEVEKADDNLRYVISNSEVMCGNIVPYSCYELATMLLQQDPSSSEGFQLLEQSVAYPSHEFQGRLRVVVAEVFRRYCRSSTAIEPLGNPQQGGIRRISGQFKAKFSKQDSFMK